MTPTERLELAKRTMRHHIDISSSTLPDLNGASKTNIMELVLSTTYLMMAELLDDPKHSWTPAHRAENAHIYRELAHELMKNWPE